MFQRPGCLLVVGRSEPKGTLDPSVRFWVIILLQGGDLVLDNLFRAQIGLGREIGELGRTGVRRPGTQEEEKYSDKPHPTNEFDGQQSADARVEENRTQDGEGKRVDLHGFEETKRGRFT